MSDLLPGNLFFLTAFVSALWLCGRCAWGFTSGSALSRFADTALVLAWFLVGVFYLLAGLGLFTRSAALLLLLTTGVVADRIQRRGRSHREGRASDSEGVPLGAPDCSAPSRWFLVPLAVVVFLRLARGLVIPPMARDALTYHLPKAVFWLQSGNRRLPAFGGDWEYYAWFRSAGDALFSWVMLPTHSDQFLGLFGVLVWCLILIAAARLARQLGASNELAWLSGGAFASLPAILAYMTANYVDNLLAFFFLCAVSHTLSYLQGDDWRHAVLGVGAVGLAVATKTSALPLAVPILIPIVFHAVQKKGSKKLLAGLSLLLAVSSWDAVTAWVAKGSPFYPFRAPLFSRLPYNQELSRLLGEGQGDLFHAVRLQFLPERVPYLNFELGGLVLLVGGLAGVLVLLVERQYARVLILTTGAALTFGLSLMPASRGLWLEWTEVFSRYLAAGFAPLLVAVAALPRPIGRVVAIASLVLSSAYLLPMGWSLAATKPAVWILGVLVVTGVLLWLLVGWIARSRRLSCATRIAVLVGGLVVALGFCAPIRDRARFSIYQEVADYQAFDPHDLSSEVLSSAPLWPCLDRAEGQTIAVAVGQKGQGHNRNLYPLFGSRLQNTVVPLAKDAGALAMGGLEGDESSLRRLASGEVDLAVGWGSPTGVPALLRAAPRLFIVRTIAKDVESGEETWVAFARSREAESFVAKATCDLSG